MPDEPVPDETDDTEEHDEPAESAGETASAREPASQGDPPAGEEDGTENVEDTGDEGVAVAASGEPGDEDAVGESAGDDGAAGVEPGEAGNDRPVRAIVGAAALAAIIIVALVLVVARRSPEEPGATGSNIVTGTTLGTTPDTVWADDTVPADTTPPPTEPASEETPIPLTRPSTVLAGKTVGKIPVYTAPSGAVKVSLPNPRSVSDEDPNATVELILLARERRGDWYEVYLPIRPNGSTGWVRRSDFEIREHDYRIEVRLKSFNLKAYEGDKLIMNTGIGVATDNTPTPGGLYFTTELIAPPDPNGPYGPYAYGLSGYSDVITSFKGGPGQLGLHGTNQPWAIGQKVSSGCIRVRNQDISALAKKLPLGVPVLVYA